MIPARVTVTLGIDHAGVMMVARDINGGAGIALDENAALLLADQLTIAVEALRKRREPRRRGPIDKYADA